jgi:hypothetical protein
MIMDWGVATKYGLLLGLVGFLLDVILMSREGLEGALKRV